MPAVHAAHSIVVGTLDAVRVHHARARLAAEIALRAQDVEVRIAFVRRRRRARIVHRRDHADRVAGDLPSKLRGGQRRADASRVDQRRRRLEVLHAVEEEWPLLGKEQGETRIDDELSGVAFHFGEVGMRGAVEGEIVGDTPTQIAAELGALTPVVPAAGSGRAKDLLRDDGIHVEHQTAFERLEPHETSPLREKRRLCPRRRGPAVLVAGVLHLADDVDVPRLQPRRLQLHTLEGNPDLHLVAICGDAPFRREDEVLAEIRRYTRGGAGGPPLRCLADFVDRAVHLDAEGVYPEEQRLSLVVKGTEQDLDVVIGIDLVAVRERGMHRAVFLECANAEVDRGRRVPDQHLCGVRRGHPIGRRELRETGEQGCPAPHPLVEMAVDDRLCLHPRRRDGQLLRAPGVDRPTTVRKQTQSDACYERGDVQGGHQRRLELHTISHRARRCDRAEMTCFYATALRAITSR